MSFARRHGFRVGVLGVGVVLGLCVWCPGLGRGQAPTLGLIDRDAPGPPLSLPPPSPQLTAEEVEAIVRRQWRILQEESQTPPAKTANQDDKAHQVGKNLDLKAAWKNGFRVETADQAFRLHIGGLLHVDAGWWQADDDLMYGTGGVGPLNDGAMFRRARLHFVGTMYEVVDWTMEVGFENRLPQFFNAYAELTQLPYVGSLRLGHFREPFGMDALTSYNNLTFAERTMLLDPFVPFFNMGMMLYGPLFDERATYATGVFRTNSDAFNAADFGDGSYSYTTRLTVNPWYVNDGASALHLAAAYSYRVLPFLNAAGQPVAVGGQRRDQFQARPEDRVNAPLFLSTGAFPADRDQRIGTEFGLSVGRMLIQAECMAACADEAAAPARQAMFQGFYVQASWFLTGESRPYNRKEGIFGAVRPHENFFLVRGSEQEGRRILHGSGAWELAARYSEVDLNHDGFRGGNLRAVTLGVNWYLNPSCRFLWNYILTQRETASPQSDGLVSTLAARFQLEF